MKHSKKKPLNNYAKYSGIAITMILIIVVGTFGGIKLDEFLDIKPVFTVILSMLSVIFAIYFVIKDLLKK